MAAVQPVPDDEIAAELAASWGPDHPAPAGAGGRSPAGRRSPVLIRRGEAGRLEPADLRRAVERVAPVSLARQRLLPLSPAFADLLPTGVARGSTVMVGAPPVTGAGPSPARSARPVGPTGATTLALALMAPASAAGSWVALVGLPALGLAAAAELGLALERLVVIEAPPPEHWATVVGALVGAFDVVAVGPPGRVRPAEVRRLTARCRERGTVLVQLGGPVAGGSERGAGPALEADLRISVATVGWDGLEAGHGLLRRRRVAVEVTGRGAAARVRRGELWLPDGEGRVRRVSRRPAPVPVLGRQSGRFVQSGDQERGVGGGVLSDAG